MLKVGIFRLRSLKNPRINILTLFASSFKLLLYENYMITCHTSLSISLYLPLLTFIIIKNQKKKLKLFKIKNSREFCGAIHPFPFPYQKHIQIQKHLPLSFHFPISCSMQDQPLPAKHFFSKTTAHTRKRYQSIEHTQPSALLSGDQISGSERECQCRNKFTQSLRD